MKKCLFKFKEFGVNTTDSIKNYISDVPYKEKEDIIEYMKFHGTQKCVCGFAKDIFTGSVIGTQTIFHDDEFSWTSDLIYYIEKYNLKLSDEFINHVMEQVEENKK